MKKIVLSLLLCLPSIIILNAQVNLSNGLVAHYKCNGNAGDSSGNNFHGTASGVVSTPDRFGDSLGAYRFDGVDDYIEVAYADSLKLRNDKSISFWYKYTGDPIGGFPTFVYMQQNSSTLYYPTFGIQQLAHSSYGNDQYKTGFFFGNSSNLSIVLTKQNYDDTSFLNRWSHVVVTYSGSTGYMKYYIDNTISDSLYVGTITSNNSNMGLQIGRAGSDPMFTGTYLKGDLDDIRFYNRAINPAEINALYTQTGSTTSLKTEDHEIFASLYPNPVNENISIETSVETTVKIFDVQGKLIFNSSTPANLHSLSTAGFANGAYIASLTGTDQSVKHIKFIVSK